MEFVHAKQSDLSQLMASYRAATKSMYEQGILQWDGGEIYPAESLLSEDIALERMYLARIEGKNRGRVFLEECGEGDYEPVAWRYEAPRLWCCTASACIPIFRGRAFRKPRWIFWSRRRSPAASTPSGWMPSRKIERRYACMNRAVTKRRARSHIAKDCFFYMKALLICTYDARSSNRQPILPQLAKGA